MSIDQLRQVQSSIWAVERDVWRVKNLMKTHPKKYKPRPGDPEQDEKKQAWGKIKFELSREFEGLVARRQRLNNEKQKILATLSRTPVPMTTLEDVIERLVRIETMFENNTPDRVHEELTSFIDKLEADAQRVNDLKGKS